MPIKYFEYSPDPMFTTRAYYDIRQINDSGVAYGTIKNKTVLNKDEDEFLAQLASKNNDLVDALALADGLCTNIRLHDPLWREVEGRGVKDMQPDEFEKSIIGHAKRKINELKQTDFEWHRIMPPKGPLFMQAKRLANMGLKTVKAFDYLNAIASAPSLNEDQSKKARATLAHIDKNPTQAKIFTRTGLHSLIEPFVTAR